MKKIIIGLLLMVLLIFCGCKQNEVDFPQEPPAENIQSEIPNENIRPNGSGSKRISGSIEFNEYIDAIEDYNNRKQQYNGHYLIFNYTNLNYAINFVDFSYAHFDTKEDKFVDAEYNLYMSLYDENLGEIKTLGLYDKTSVMIIFTSYQFIDNNGNYTYNVKKYDSLGYYTFEIDIINENKKIGLFEVLTTKKEYATEEWALNLVKENMVLLK